MGCARPELLEAQQHALREFAFGLPARGLDAIPEYRRPGRPVRRFPIKAKLQKGAR